MQPFQMQQSQQFGNPNGMMMMGPCGAGGPCGDMFGQMNGMMQNMNSMMMGMNSMMSQSMNAMSQNMNSMSQNMNSMVAQQGPQQTGMMAAPGGSSMMMMNVGGGCGSSCQTMMMSSTVGQDGQMRTERYRSSHVRDSQGSMQETRQAYSNDHTGVDRLSHEQELDGRGRRTTRQRCRRTGDQVQNNLYIDMDEEDEEDFERQWQQESQARLPQHASSIGIGRGQPGQQQIMMSNGAGGQQMLMNSGGQQMLMNTVGQMLMNSGGQQMMMNSGGQQIMMNSGDR